MLYALCAMRFSGQNHGRRRLKKDPSERSRPRPFLSAGEERIGLRFLPQICEKRCRHRYRCPSYFDYLQPGLFDDARVKFAQSPRPEPKRRKITEEEGEKRGSNPPPRIAASFLIRKKGGSTTSEGEGGMSEKSQPTNPLGHSLKREPNSVPVLAQMNEHVFHLFGADMREAYTNAKRFIEMNLTVFQIL